jgi:hypothetical protein
MLNNSGKRLCWLTLLALALGCHQPVLEKQIIPERIKLAEVFGQPIYSDEIDVPDCLMFEDAHKLKELKEKPNKYEFAKAIIIKLEKTYEIEHNLHVSPEEIWELNYAGWKIIEPGILMDREESLLKLSTENICQSDRERLIHRIAGFDKMIAMGSLWEKPLNKLSDEELESLGISDTVNSTDAKNILRWKFNKAIYNEYGGKVCIPSKSNFPSDDIPESIEAIAKWIRKLENTGELVIYDNDLKKYLFEKCYPLDANDAVFPPENYFDYPPWNLEGRNRTNE